METKHYFYVLLCQDGSFYGGYTTEPKRRVQEHNSGSGAKYTRAPSRRPVQMIHLESFDTRKEATRAEYAFKKLTKQKKISYLKTNIPVYTIRPFQSEDAEAVAKLLKRNFLEVNSRDYPIEQMLQLTKEYTAEKMINQSLYANTYVAEIGDTIIGTVGICPYFGSETESVLLTFFVLPEYQLKGIGLGLFQFLKTDPFYTRAEKIIVSASRTSLRFYEKIGFIIRDKEVPEDEYGYVLMERSNR